MAVSRHVHAKVVHDHISEVDEEEAAAEVNGRRVGQGLLHLCQDVHDRCGYEYASAETQEERDQQLVALVAPVHVAWQHADDKAASAQNEHRQHLRLVYIQGHRGVGGGFCNVSHLII